MAVAKGTKLHTSNSIKKMLATRKRNKALKLLQHTEDSNKILHIDLPGVQKVVYEKKPPIRIEAARDERYRQPTPAENLEILYGRLSQHFSAAEAREIEEAIRILKVFDFMLQIASKKF